MSSNARIYFPCQAISFAPESTLSFSHGRGVQSVGINTNITLDRIFQLSEASIYENVEALPEVQITAQKVLDGNTLLYHYGTQGAADASLTARAKPRCNMVLGVFSDSQSAASGRPIAECYVSGAFVGSIAYNFPVDGNFTEDVTYSANDKIWFDRTDSSTALASGTFTNASVPLASTGSGGVNRRQDFVWLSSAPLGTRDANGMVQTGTTAATQMTILPPDIDGISASGTNDQTAGVYGAHVQTIQVNCDFTRQDLNELGRLGPYFKFVSFPVDVNCSISTIATKWDHVSVTQAGTVSAGTNLVNRTIKIKTTEGTFIDLGTKNKLSSVSYDGGDTGGGVVNVTYNYQTSNDLTVTHPMDSTQSLRQG